MKGLPDLSAMMATQLGQPRVGPTDPPSKVRIIGTSDATLQHWAPSPDAAAAAPRKKKGKKRYRDDPSTSEDHETIPVMSPFLELDM